ncbi:MAG TPA: hypothetical protein EYN68_10170, partial [Candidatus Marinimicrobia bacterium]|nr:hypothetical protein [Candidatus Neomarinimicrobiota bacterium]
MKKSTLILFVCFAATLLAQSPVPKRMQAQVQPATMKFQLEGEPTLIYSNSNSHSPRVYRSTSSVSTVLVDSSRNGYGMVVGNTTPLSYHPDNGFIMAYRQWSFNDPI